MTSREQTTFTVSALRQELEEFGRTTLRIQLEQVIQQQLDEYFQETPDRNTSMPVVHHTETPLGAPTAQQSTGFFQGYAPRFRASTTMTRPARRSIGGSVKEMGWLKFALGRGTWDTVTSMRRRVIPRKSWTLNWTPSNAGQTASEDVLTEMERFSERASDNRRSRDRNSHESLGMDSSQSATLRMVSSHSERTTTSLSVLPSRLESSSYGFRDTVRDTMSKGGMSMDLDDFSKRSATTSVAGMAMTSMSRRSSYNDSKVKFNHGSNRDWTELNGNDEEIDEEEDLIRPLWTEPVRPSVATVDRGTVREIMSDTSSLQGFQQMNSLRPNPWSVKGFVQSVNFDYTMTCLVVLNSILTGYQTDYMANHSDEPIPMRFVITQSGFCFVFIIEMSLRFWLDPPGNHPWDMPAGWRNFQFDLAVITAELLRELLHYYTFVFQCRSRFNFHILPLRMGRFLFVFPSRELHQLCVSILESYRYLVNACVLIVVITFVFGVFFVEFIVFLKVCAPKEIEEEHRRELEFHFGTVPRAMLSLFQVISDGLHWHDLADPLIATWSEWTVLPFIIYVALAVYSLMNIIVGIFVDSAVRTADVDNKVSLIQEMHAMFQLADEDGSGTLSWDEFERFLDHPQMNKLLRAIDLDQDHARQLFRLLDEDHSSEINHKTFVNRCMRFHGAAKAVDLAAFMHEYQRTMKTVMDILEDVEQYLYRGPSANKGGQA